MRRLCQLYVEYGMDRPGLLKMRTLVPRFLKGLPGAREIRRDIVFCATWEQVFGTLDKHFHGTLSRVDYEHCSLACGEDS